jgi:ankyrin repeat protein
VADNQESLWKASQHGKLEEVIILLQQGVSVDVGHKIFMGATPLYIASQNGHLEVVKELIQHGASVDIATTTAGTTPLLIASEKGHSKW